MGNLTACEEEIENRFGYTGEQFDAITKQYYLRATFYNPVVARLTQEDTYRGAGLNLYAYCANNPVGYVDSSGHQPQCVKDAAAKYMAEGLGKGEAYRKAYQNHAKQKLANAASLPVQERIKLEERARRLGLEVDSSVNREKNPEAKMPDAEQRDKGVSGQSAGNIDYKKIFFDKHPELKGKVVVHHSIEQQIIKRYPGLFTKEEINSYDMLRGIPKELNSDIHLSRIRVEWNNFYKKIDAGEIPLTRESFLNQVKQIDNLFGGRFNPPK